MTLSAGKIDWNTNPIPVSHPLSALIPITHEYCGTHRLQLIATGPPRKPSQPVVIFEAGFGGDAYEFATVMRLVAEMGIVRCFAYNRMGTRESDLRSNLQEELSRLIKTMEETSNGTNVARDEASNISGNAAALEDGQSNKKPATTKDEVTATRRTITATHCVWELSALLAAADIPGPYITVSHSWGGIISCQWAALSSIPLPYCIDPQPNELQPGKGSNNQIVGMVFIDANQESSHDKRNINRMMDVWQILSPIDQTELFDYKTRCVRPGAMTESEWAKCNDEASWSLEWNLKKLIMVEGMILGWDESLSMLKSHRILKRVDDGFEPFLTFHDPVTGVKKRGYVSAIWAKLQQAESQSVYEEAIKLGLGTEVEREWMRELVDSEGEKEREMQKGFLKLASEGRGRLVEAAKSAHNAHKTEPELVAREIRWVVEGWANL